MKNMLKQSWTSRNVRLLLVAVMAFATVVTLSPLQGTASAITCQKPWTLNLDSNRCECDPPYAFNSITRKCEPTPTQPAGTTDGGSPGSTDPCVEAANDPQHKVICYKPGATETDPALKGGNCANLNKCDLIKNYINPALRFLSAFIGIGVTIAIIYGGIEYGSSGGDPAKAAAGKNRIRNALVTLIGFFFLYALLNFLVPGGLNS